MIYLTSSLDQISIKHLNTCICNISIFMRVPDILKKYLALVFLKFYSVFQSDKKKHHLLISRCFNYMFNENNFNEQIVASSTKSLITKMLRHRYQCHKIIRFAEF